MKIVDEKFEWRKYVWQWQSACGVSSRGVRSDEGGGPPRVSSCPALEEEARVSRLSAVYRESLTVLCCVDLVECVLCYFVVCSDDDRLCLTRMYPSAGAMNAAAAAAAVAAARHPVTKQSLRSSRTTSNWQRLARAPLQIAARKF